MNKLESGIAKCLAALTHVSSSRPATRRQERLRSLRVEALEDRRVLSTILGVSTPWTEGPLTASETVAAPVANKAKAPSMPDLAIVKFKNWNSNIPIGTQLVMAEAAHKEKATFYNDQPLYFNFCVTNKGKVSATSFGISLTIGNVNGGSLVYQFSYAGTLAAGAKSSYPFDVEIAALPAGSHTFTFAVDTTGAVAESNETNNTFTRTINVIARQNESNVRVVPYFGNGTNGGDLPGNGFFDAKLGAKRRAALEFAFGEWSKVLPAAYAGETITVDVSMPSMGGLYGSSVLAQCGPETFWVDGPLMPNTVYGTALANHLSGTDLNPGVSEIVMYLNADVDNALVLGNRSWYYGSDGKTGNNLDMVSVVMHEMGHGLNMLDLIDTSGAIGLGGMPGIYDRFLQSGGVNLTDMDNAGRAAAIVSDNLFWSGSQGIAGNGGNQPKIFAPTTYQDGSSVAHVDESTYPNDLMSPYYSGVQHTISSMDLGIFRDMGWSFTGTGAPVLPTGASAVPLRMPRRMISEEYVSPAGNADRAEQERARMSAALDWLLAQRGDSDRLKQDVAATVELRYL